MRLSLCGDDVRSRISTDVGAVTDVDVRPSVTSTSVDVRSVNRPLYNVVDSARSHADDDLSVNHGGVTILVDADIALSPINIADQPTTFDIICARARVGCFAAIVVLLYRPRSQQQQTFFDELRPV